MSFQKLSTSASETLAAVTVLFVARLAAHHGVAAELSGRDCVALKTTHNGVTEEGYKLCVGRAYLVEVGQNTSIDLTWYAQDTLNVTSSITFDVDVGHDHIAEAPSEVTFSNESYSVDKLWIRGAKAGKTVISFSCNCTGNETNASCPIPDELLSQVKREVSFVHYLLLEICAIIVGWTYTIFWIVSYYPQTYYSCKRQSVAGLNFNFVGMCFASNVAYLAFNAGLFWIPEVQEEYFKRHPEGVNPVQINDVIFSIHATTSVGIWILQCAILKRDKNQGVGLLGGMYIGSLWLTMLICVVLGALGILKWLDALYYISFITLVTTVVKYIPLIWSNYRRKSTEGFSPYTTTMNLIGGLFSLLQMLIIAYNYDDWKSIFGDPTKFGYGLITVGFEVIHFAQHYVFYRGAWMKKYKLTKECDCTEIGCKHSKKKTNNNMRNTLALPDKKIVLKSIEYYV